MRKLLGFVLLLSMSSCSMYKDIEVQHIDNITIAEIGKNYVDLEVELRVDNPNWYKVKLVDSEIEVKINESSIGEVSFLEKVVIPKDTVMNQTIVIRGYSDNISQLVMKNFLEVLFTKKITVEANGYVKGRALGLGKKVPVSAKEEVSIDDININ